MAAAMLLKNIPVPKPHGGMAGVLYIRSANYASDIPEEMQPRPLKTTNLAAMRRGTGGRSSFNGIVATVFGCTGFLGRYVCNKLGKMGTQLILPYRGDHGDAIRLKVCGDLGQVLFHPFHLGDEQSIFEAVKYSNVVINLIGRDWETKNFKFSDVHIDGARRIARVCMAAGVDRLIHVSALNADPEPRALVLEGGSNWLRSKYWGECAVREEFPSVTVLRPSDIYGSEDRFLRMYAHMWRRQFRSMPLWHKGEKTVKQPVYVSDVAQGIVNAAKDPDTACKTYQAVGPKRYQLSELVDWFHRIMRKDPEWWGYSRYDMRYDPTVMLKAKLTEAICPGFPLGDFHPERLEREFVTDEVSESIPTLEDLGVQITAMEDQVPWELRPFRAALYYNADLNEFETPSAPKTIDSREEKRIFAS